MLKVEEKVTFIWQNIHPEKFDPYIYNTIQDNEIHTSEPYTDDCSILPNLDFCVLNTT